MEDRIVVNHSLSLAAGLTAWEGLLSICLPTFALVIDVFQEQTQGISFWKGLSSLAIFVSRCSLWSRPCYVPDSWFWINIFVLSALESALQRLSAVKVILELELYRIS